MWGPANVVSVEATIDEGVECWPPGSAHSGKISSNGSGRPIDGVFIVRAVNNAALVALSYPRMATQAVEGTGASNVPDKPATPAETTQYNLQITDGGVASWQKDTGITDIPNAPAQANVAKRYNIEVLANGTVQWIEDTVTREGSDVPNAPAAAQTIRRYVLVIGADGGAAWEQAPAVPTNIPNAPAGLVAVATYVLQVAVGRYHELGGREWWRWWRNSGGVAGLPGRCRHLLLEVRGANPEHGRCGVRQCHAGG